jgi:ceramide glucosyltransferase
MMVAELAIGFCAAATLVHLATITMAGIRCRRRSARPISLERMPPVSVLRPVCGAENFLDETLASTFRLDCPEYEIIFCAARADDAAVPIVNRLIAANPQIPARLLVGDDGIGANPKLSNLVKGWDAARYDWVLIADSNALLRPDLVRDLFAAWRPNTGVVCSMPIGSRPKTFAAELECAFLNTLQARFQYVSETLGWGFAQGKTMLFRRDIVDAAGGIRALAAETAEDAAMTKLVRGAGLHVHLVDRAVEQPLGTRRLSEVWTRQLRWARLRRVSFPLLFLPELLVGGTFPAAALGIAAWDDGFALSAATILILLLIWLLAEGLLAAVTGWHFTARAALAMALRDLLLPALWVAAWLGNDYVWRGNPITASSGNDGRVGQIRRSGATRTYVEIKRRFWQGA